MLDGAAGEANFGVDAVAFLVEQPRPLRYAWDRFQQAMVEAWSVRCTFAELEARPETVPEMALWLTPAAHSGVGGVLKLDARGHSYDIRAQFPAGCVAVKHRDKWVRARTMLHQRAEDWEDETHQMGAHLSPLVAVEIEQGASFALP